MEFSPSPEPTVGIEWELQLLDSETLDLSNGIVPLMEFYPDTRFVKPELIQSSVEINSCVGDNSDMAVANVQKTLKKLLERCDDLEMGLCGGGTHPFCRRLALITPLPRYQKLEEASGYLAHTQITYSTHVHVGMESGDQAMLAMRRLVPVIPAFIAVSANSPFWRGHETGHAAYRQRILAATPNYGLPTVFDNWRDFVDFFAVARRGGMIRTFKDIHWDIRPHPDFGTLEIRVMDSASNLRELHGLVAFARSMALRVCQASERDYAELLTAGLPFWIEKQNSYSASVNGLDAKFIIDAKGTKRPLRDVVSDLLDFCEPAAAAHDETSGLRIIRSILEDGAGYEAQLEAHRGTNSARAVVEMLKADLASF